VKASAAALLVAVVAGCGGTDNGELQVMGSTLQTGQIRLAVHNGAGDAALIAQVIVNDAFVDFHASRPRLPQGATETVTIPYHWIAGENYDVRLMLSTGRTLDFEIEDAA
jgi:zinc transporter, ZIP family